jgi:hypothetical protein
LPVKLTDTSRSRKKGLLRKSKAASVGGLFHLREKPAGGPAGALDTCAPHAVATLELKNPKRDTMADDDLQDLTNARKVLVEMRHNWAKAIAAGYKRGETETAIKDLIEVQQTIDVIDRAIDELEEVEEEEEDDEEDDDE